MSSKQSYMYKVPQIVYSYSYFLKKCLFSLCNNRVSVILYELVGMCGWTYAGLCAWDFPSIPAWCWGWRGGLSPGTLLCDISPGVAFCPLFPRRACLPSPPVLGVAGLLALASGFALLLTVWTPRAAHSSVCQFGLLCLCSCHLVPRLPSGPGTWNRCLFL